MLRVKSIDMDKVLALSPINQKLFFADLAKYADLKPFINSPAFEAFILYSGK